MLDSEHLSLFRATRHDVTNSRETIHERKARRHSLSLSSKNRSPCNPWEEVPFYPKFREPSFARPRNARRRAVPIREIDFERILKSRKARDRLLISLIFSLHLTRS